MAARGAVPRVTALLDIVSEARELRDAAEEEFRRALVKAHEAGHSLRVIGGAAGMSWSNVRKWILEGKPSERREKT